MALRTLTTDRFGEIEIDDETIISLPDGLLGFVTIDRVVLLPIDPDSMFFWMQAVDDPATAFLVLNPWPFFPDYQCELSDADEAALEIEEPGEAMVLCVVTSHDEPRRFTANLAGPVVVNERLRRGRQVVLEVELPTQAELPPMP